MWRHRREGNGEGRYGNWGGDREGDKILSIKINKLKKKPTRTFLKAKKEHEYYTTNIAQTQNLLSNATERNKQTYTKNKAKQNKKTGNWK